MIAASPLHLEDISFLETLAEMTITSAPTPLGTLVCLPREIRDDIYSYLFGRSHRVEWVYMGFWICHDWEENETRRQVDHVILRLSKQIHNEALQVLYARSEFLYEYRLSVDFDAAVLDRSAHVVRQDLIKDLDFSLVDQSIHTIREILMMDIQVTIDMKELRVHATRADGKDDDRLENLSKLIVLRRLRKDILARRRLHIKFTNCSCHHSLLQIPLWMDLGDPFYLTNDQTIIIEVEIRIRYIYEERILTKHIANISRELNSLQTTLENILGPATLLDRKLIRYELIGQAPDMADEGPFPSHDTFYFARRLEFHPCINEKVPGRLISESR